MQKFRKTFSTCMLIMTMPINVSENLHYMFNCVKLWFIALHGSIRQNLYILYENQQASQNMLGGIERPLNFNLMRFVDVNGYGNISKLEALFLSVKS